MQFRCYNPRNKKCLRCRKLLLLIWFPGKGVAVGIQAVLAGSVRIQDGDDADAGSEMPLFPSASSWPEKRDERPKEAGTT